MFFYAQLNDKDICVGVSALSGQISKKNMVEIDTLNEDFLWRKFDRLTGEWSKKKYEPRSTAPIDEFAQLKRDNELNKQAIAELSMLLAQQSGGEA